MADGCRLAELRCREVINLCDGCRMGYVGDLEIDIMCGRVVALVVPGRARFFGLLGREDDYIIPWERIEKIGADIILVRFEAPIRRPKEKPSFFKRFS